MVKYRPNIPRPSVAAGEPVPPIDPIIGECPWFYNDDAGGFMMSFGKYRDQKIHGIPFGYIAWFQREFKGRQRCKPLLKAASDYIEGLEGYMEEHYGEFLVPIGKAYRGTRINRVRNKPWMMWLKGWIKRRELEREYGLFLDALQLWLDHPRHQEVKRDIGERTDRDPEDDALEDEEDLEFLPESEWEDDVGEDTDEDKFYADEKEVWEQKDLDFLDDSDACSMIMNGSDDYVPSEAGDGSTSGDKSGDHSTSGKEDSEQGEGSNEEMSDAAETEEKESDGGGEGEDDSNEERDGSDNDDESGQDESMQESKNEEEQNPPPAGSEPCKNTPVDDGAARNTKRISNSSLMESEISDMDDDEPLDAIQERILSTPKKDRRRYPQHRYVQSPSP